MSERAIQNGYLIVAQQEIDELRRQKAALVEALEYIDSATEGIEAPIDPDEYVEITITGKGLIDLRSALAAAKGKP